MNLMFCTTLTFFFPLNLHLVPSLDLVNSTWTGTMNRSSSYCVFSSPPSSTAGHCRSSWDGHEGLDLSLWALTESPQALKALRVEESLCEPHRERRSRPQWIKGKNCCVQGQLSHSLQRLGVMNFSFMYPLFPPAVMEAQILSTLC